MEYSQPMGAIVLQQHAEVVDRRPPYTHLSQASQRIRKTTEDARRRIQAASQCLDGTSTLDPDSDDTEIKTFFLVWQVVSWHRLSRKNQGPASGRAALIFLSAVPLTTSASSSPNYANSPTFSRPALEKQIIQGRLLRIQSWRPTTAPIFFTCVRVMPSDERQASRKTRGRRVRSVDFHRHALARASPSTYIQ